MSSRSALALLACLFFTACSDGEEEEGTDTDDSSTGAGDSEPTGGDPACACIDPEMPGFASYICAGPPCGAVTLVCNDMEAGPGGLVESRRGGCDRA